MNFEKPPEGGGVIGLIRNSPESARLCFHYRPRNRGKGREVVKVYNKLFNFFYPQRKWISKNADGGSTTWKNQNSTKSARLSFHCKPINRGKGAPQAAHTGARCKNREQLPSAGISSAVFFAYATLTSSENWKKTDIRNKMSIQFYIPQWTVNNVKTKNMVTQCQKKCADCFYWNNWPLNCLF